MLPFAQRMRAPIRNEKDDDADLNAHREGHFGNRRASGFAAGERSGDAAALR